MQSLVTPAPDQSYTLTQYTKSPWILDRLRAMATWYRDLCADSDDAWRQFPDANDDFARCQRHVFCNMLLVLAGKPALL